jgi:hypothetical protein
MELKMHIVPIGKNKMTENQEQQLSENDLDLADFDETINPKQIPKFMVSQNRPPHFKKLSLISSNSPGIRGSIGSVYKIILHPRQNFRFLK